MSKIEENQVFSTIKDIIDKAKQEADVSVNAILTETYWHVGHGLSNAMKLESTQLELKEKFPTASGISLTETMDALVEYTRTCFSKDIFFSKYLVELPSKEVLEAFIEKELKENNEIYDDKN